jgi:hypothetical protein
MRPGDDTIVLPSGVYNLTIGGVNEDNAAAPVHTAW